MQIEIKETDFISGQQTFVRLSTGQTFSVTAPGVIDTGEATAEIVHAAEDGPGPTQDFLQALTTKANLEIADKGLIRVLEDVVAALVAKGTIAMTDLPKVTRDKFAAREVLRAELGKLA